MQYVLAVMANDPSRVIRRHVARSACQSLALLVSMGEMKTSTKEQESLLIEEDGSVPEKTKEAKKSDVEMMVRVLRKDREVGKNEVLREFLMPIALYETTLSASLFNLSSHYPELQMSIKRFAGESLSLRIFSSKGPRKFHQRLQFIFQQHLFRKIPHFYPSSKRFPRHNGL